MEKIYMEEQKSSRKLITSQTKFSIALSFMVVAFALVSLVAFGFNQLSYAAEAGDSFPVYTAKRGSEEIRISVVGADSTEFPLVMPYYAGVSQTYGDSAMIQLFCIEYNSVFPVAGEPNTYTKEEPVPDNGLLYLLNQSKILGGPGYVPEDYIDFMMRAADGLDRAVVSDLVERYATQAAIWLYMDEHYGAGDSRYSLARPSMGITAEQNINRIKNASAISVTGFSSDLPLTVEGLYDIAIAPKLEAANAGATDIALTVSREDSSISKVGDDGYYQTSKIQVTGTPTDDLLSFDVSVSGLDGAVVIDSKGAEKTHFELATGDGNEFYVRVPVDKVTDKASTVDVSVTGTFDNSVGAAVYKGGEYQRVVAITGKGHASDTLRIDFAYVPPTGMSKTQTIYFIGLIVLLCGVGIVYANAKPVKTEE